jgi:hypothetical protein
MRKRLKDVLFGESTEAALVELGQLGAEARAAGDVEATAVARSVEVRHARFLGKHQHAVVIGAELLELWPDLRKRPIPERTSSRSGRSSSGA